MVGLWPGLWRGNGVVVLGSAVSAVGPAGCQAGKGVPGPAWSRTRKGKGWGQKGQSGARGGVTPGGSHRLPPGRLCPSASPRAAEQGWGDNVLLDLAQNKQPSAAGENSWPFFQADREMVEPFSSGHVPTGSCSSINPLWLDGSTELVPGLALAPQGWDRASPILCFGAVTTFPALTLLTMGLLGCC